MSAYVVNDNHINVIVSYFVNGIKSDSLWTKIDGQYDYLTLDNAAKVAQTLYKENLRSVNHRYNEQAEADYLFEWINHANQAYTIGEIARALDGLEYQSCETEDYHQSEAWEILCTMRKKLLSNFADKEDADTWEISEVRSKFHLVS